MNITYKNKKSNGTMTQKIVEKKIIIIEIKFVSDSRLYKIIILMNISVSHCPIIEMYVSIFRVIAV